MMESCVNCGFESDEAWRFIANDPPLCVGCHLALAEESRESGYHEVPFGIPRGFELIREWGGMRMSSPIESKQAEDGQ